MRITSCRAFSFMSFPNDSVICSKRDRSPTPALILFFPLHSSLFSPSFFIRCPDKTFLPVIYRVTNGVPRGLYSRVAVTPLASSPWPAHAIYLSRLRDSSLRSLSFSPSHSSSRRLPCNVPLQLPHSCIIRAAKPFLDQLSRSTGIFSLRGREPCSSNLPRKRFKSIYREYPRLLESTFLLQFEPNLGLFRRETSIILRYYTAAYFSRIIDLTGRQHISHVRSMALIINYLLIP